MVLAAAGVVEGAVRAQEHQAGGLRLDGVRGRQEWLRGVVVEVVAWLMQAEEAPKDPERAEELELSLRVTLHRGRGWDQASVGGWDVRSIWVWCLTRVYAGDGPSSPVGGALLIALAFVCASKKVCERWLFCKRCEYCSL